MAPDRPVIRASAGAAFIPAAVSLRIGRHHPAARRFYERPGYVSVRGFDIMEKPLH